MQNNDLDENNLLCKHDKKAFITLNQLTWFIFKLSA